MVHIPYLAQATGCFDSAGLGYSGKWRLLSSLDIHWIVILIFGAFLYLSTKGLSTQGDWGLGGSAMLDYVFPLRSLGGQGAFIKP